MTATIANNGCEFTANGSIITFDGYLAVYKDYEQTKDELLPDLEEKEVLKHVQLDGRQHFTEPPARYSEARLIKEMEEKGIGRPSTYAMIIDTIQARGYVSLEKASEGSKTKVFFPTEQGILTDKKLQEFFSAVINVSYTANMEKDLDEIAEGERDNVKELREFYDQFMPLLDHAYENMEKRNWREPVSFVRNAAMSLYTAMAVTGVLYPVSIFQAVGIRRRKMKKTMRRMRYVLTAAAS